MLTFDAVLKHLEDEFAKALRGDTLACYPQCAEGTAYLLYSMLEDIATLKSFGDELKNARQTLIDRGSLVRGFPAGAIGTNVIATSLIAELASEIGYIETVLVHESNRFNDGLPNYRRITSKEAFTEIVAQLGQPSWVVKQGSIKEVCSYRLDSSNRPWIHFELGPQ
jgi:hypothetical protein